MPNSTPGDKGPRSVFTREWALAILNESQQMRDFGLGYGSEKMIDKLLAPLTEDDLKQLLATHTGAREEYVQKAGQSGEVDYGAWVGNLLQEAVRRIPSVQRNDDFFLRLADLITDTIRFAPYYQYWVIDKVTDVARVKAFVDDCKARKRSVNFLILEKLGLDDDPDYNNL